MKLAIYNLLFCSVFVFIIAPFIIKWLTKLKFGQSILIYVEKHKAKAGTPTMGGIIFILSTIIGYVLFYKEDNILSTITLLSFLFFGVVGFLDDFIKIKFKQNEGLKPYQKIIGQLAIAIILSIFIYKSPLVGSDIYLPFSSKKIDLGIFIIPFVIVVYLAVVNSVNLIDGLDGLCSCVSIIVILVLSIILYILSANYNGVYLNEISNIQLLSFGLLGSLIGFVAFNSFPASVFMGDTGSLAIGGFIGSVALLTKNSLLLLIIGFMYVLTTISVIIQVIVYKLTKKRVFKMSPIHHHFEQSNHEVKVVVSYMVITFLIGILTIGIYLGVFNGI